MQYYYLQSLFSSYEQIKECTYSSVFIGIDETGIRSMDKKIRCETGKMTNLLLLYTLKIAVLKPLKILLATAYQMPLYKTTCLPAILIATPCIIRFAAAFTS